MSALRRHGLLQQRIRTPWPSSISRSSSSRAACWRPTVAPPVLRRATTASRWISSPASSSRCISTTPTAPRPSAAIRWPPSTTTRSGPGEAVEIAVSYVAGGAATALFEGLDDRRHDRRQRPVRPLLPDAGRRQPALPADRHRHRRHAVSRDAAAAGTADRASAASRWCCCSARARRRSCCTATSSAPSPTSIRRLPLRALLLARTAGRRFAAGARRRAPWLRAAVPGRVRARRRQPTSPTCAATRTWSMPASRR